LVSFILRSNKNLLPFAKRGLLKVFPEPI